MGQLLYPTTKYFNGPWLISKADLEELDKIVKTVNNHLQKSLDTEVRDLVLSHEQYQNLPEDKVEQLVDKTKSDYPFNKKNKLVLFPSRVSTHSMVQSRTRRHC